MANLLSSSGSGRSSRCWWSAEDVFTSEKSATKNTSKKLAMKADNIKAFGVSFGKAEKDIAQSKLLEHWCEHSICSGWAPGRRSGSSTWSKQNRKKKRGGAQMMINWRISNEREGDKLWELNRSAQGHGQAGMLEHQVNLLSKEDKPTCCLTLYNMSITTLTVKYIERQDKRPVILEAGMGNSSPLGPWLKPGLLSYR